MSREEPMVVKKILDSDLEDGSICSSHFGSSKGDNHNSKSENVTVLSR